MNKRVSIFVDGGNVYFAQRDAGMFLDWKKVLKYWEKYGQLYETFYYLGEHIPPLARTERFLKLLQHLKFIIRRKKIKTIYLDDGSTKQKANLDIEIAMDMFNTVDNYDIAVLFSGDGDFERAIELIRARGKEIYVVSTREYVARELQNSVGRNFIDFTDMSDWKLRDWERNKEKPPTKGA